MPKFSKREQFPLPSLTSALPPCSRRLEFIQPLVTRAAGRGLAGHPRSVRLGYGDNKTRLFTPIRSKTPTFQRCGLHLGAGRERSRSALRGDDVAGKRSHRNGPSSSERVRLLQPLLPHPQKDGGLRPILDLRRLNHALMRRPFRMITLKQILSQIRTGDWFCSLDLKDAYFHIQIAPHHRRFLRFAFEGVAYQYTVLPFGLSLPPRIFTKCMDAALSPLRTDGNPHSQLPRRLAHSGPVRGGATFAQSPPPQPLRAPGAQGQFRQGSTNCTLHTPVLN